GHVYIAYEYIPGKTMRQALGAGELDDRAAVEVAAQVLEALAHAHGRGIVHRDVKPSNVLLAESGAIDVRLLDFGLAQMAEFDTLTAMGDVPGTLGYISPERLLGKPATDAADIWSVGVMLWESLAGHHPFRDGGVKETSRRIQTGPPPLGELRPDLPRELCEVVASALWLNPARRPAAGRLAVDLRGALRPKRRGRGGGARKESAPKAATTIGVASLAERALPAVGCAVAAGWVAERLSFYPAHWPIGIAGLAGVLALAAPRVGLAFALTSAFFPLANISLGLGAVYAAVAAAWLALGWNDTRGSLLALAGPLLAPVGGLGLVPLAVQPARGAVRRAVQAGCAVLLAAVVAGLDHRRLPFDHAAAPLGLGIEGSRRPTAVAYALWRTLVDHPALLGETAVVAAAAAGLSRVRGRGPWHAAVFAAAFLVAAVAVAPSVSVVPLVLAAWVTAAALALEPRH
ncbi:MAG: serine/threonine protein kinase, partial [Actinobacteria bacterium]|nr:serine/threonine protein kinase [Actinomycetota bacterium]